MRAEPPRRSPHLHGAAPRRGGERGFTLLEVMCAFAILVTLTAFVTQGFRANIDKATTALARRELREAADTVFRKIIYQYDDYKDGDSRSLDEAYGEIARLRGAARDRWHIYKYVLEKKEETVAGYDPEGETGLFGDTGTGTRSPTTAGSGTTGGGGSTTTGGLGAAEGELEGESHEMLLRLTLRLYRTDEPETQPLLVISTWIDPDKGKDVVRR